MVVDVDVDVVDEAVVVESGVGCVLNVVVGLVFEVETVGCVPDVVLIVGVVSD